MLNLFRKLKEIYIFIKSPNRYLLDLRDAIKTTSEEVKIMRSELKSLSDDLIKLNDMCNNTNLKDLKKSDIIVTNSNIYFDDVKNRSEDKNIENQSLKN